jgi:dTDP-4-dehydrorhamnose 3,5-epimerase/CDP-3, 6-dideoxy-D-glycero-D-glycero-4-hexulose-5-epimerase
MDFSREVLPGALHIGLRRFTDLRGEFVKTYARSAFDAGGVDFDFREEFYSRSKKGVIRGMHFQLPPHHHSKVVFCPGGTVLDVLLDLRTGEGYGRSVGIVLSAANPSALIIPPGIAHGFLALDDDSLMVYKTSTEHAPSHDVGLRWDGFGFDWGCAAPIVSDRDRGHPAFADFRSPF